MELVYMITIVDRELAEKHADFLFHEGAHMTLQAKGRGTANDEILDILGIGETEKEVMFSTMKKEKANRIIDILSTERYLSRPGTGIAFTIPIMSVCGSSSLSFISGELSIDRKEVEKVTKEMKYELIIAITNRGYVDPIMDAAREQGVGGGTVIHTISPNAEKASKFFGINVGKEKDLIMIVVDKAIRRDVMKAITDVAGTHTKAKCVMFSMPVSGVAGIMELEQ